MKVPVLLEKALSSCKDFHNENIDIDRDVIEIQRIWHDHHQFNS